MSSSTWHKVSSHGITRALGTSGVVDSVQLVSQSVCTQANSFKLQLEG